ncbi:MAG: molybdopterin oxidoreductase Fe4S4 region [Candidatus Rokubacteria bacterium CSP1-6]|nr:MAG: molybdopterin oxidoreductase Fe4S4 region [Candidatus Rokubacteria bacterium CSP1-6]
MRVTRRGFFQAAGGTAGAAALIRGTLAKAQQAGEDLTRWATPEEVPVPSICQQCPGGCGLMVRTLDGEVAGLSGNPLHPINRGALCPKAFGGLQLLYDPNRLKGPMARDGERGRFRPIGWDEALSMLTARLADLRAKGLSHTVAILGGQYRGYRDTLWKRFAEAYGTPNYIRVRCLPPERPALAHQLMQGVTSPLGYDLGEAHFILSFGAGLLEAWLGPVHVSQAFARLRRSGERPRGRFVQVDPRRSPTAVKADRWVPIVPGTDGILALGIANALIREELYDKEFIAQHTFGFEDWVDQRGAHHEGFKNFVLKEYGLLAVSAATGVPVRTILEVARDLGTTKPAMVIGERGTAYGPDDLHTRMAIHSLNALVGSIGVRGGLLIQGELPLSPLRPVQKDEAAARALERPRIDGAGRGQYLLASDAPQALPERILSAKPYPINALLLFATNPLANHPAKEAFAKAFEGIPFIVSFSPFLDESSSRADLILPDHTYLERWQDDQVTHLAGFTCFSLARPATAPLHQTRNTADVVLQIAKALGGTIAKNVPWQKFEDFLHERARGLYEAGRGYVASAPAEESLRKILERQGYWTSEFKSYDEFWAALGKRGAWWDPTGLPVSLEALHTTPSRKFEFYASGLKRLVDEAVKRDGTGEAFVQALGGRDRGDLLYLPAVAIPAVREPGAFPFRLNTYRLMSRPTGGGRNQPWLLEQPAVHVRATWEGWVEIHPKTAAEVGVKGGDWVWVESAKGRIRLKAKLYAGTLPYVIHIPLFGGEGPNPNDLIANETDPFRGFGLLNTTRVRILKA